MAREQLARVFSPTRSALSAAALAVSAAAIVLISTQQIWKSQPVPHETTQQNIERASDDDVDLLSTSEDPFASLTDDELREVEQMMTEPSDMDDETGT